MSESKGDRAQQQRRHPRRRRRARQWQTSHLRTVQEYSAGGLVVDGLDGETQVAALIGKSDRRGGRCWTIPKGHIEIGERAEQTAIREVAEETGIRGDVLAALGSVDYWFRAKDHIVHKTVHHYLLRFLDSEPCAKDHEVEEVAWVPLDELPARLTHADERQLGEVAAHLIGILRTHGAAALPPLPDSSPRRPPKHTR
jgi:8-oxo-dGTP pyrophosphatase MutT (NUDIX family)